METSKSGTFWWLKSPSKPVGEDGAKEEKLPLVPKLDLGSLRGSASYTDILEQDSNADNTDVDVGSIIEEINRVAAQSPLGPFEKSIAERSIDDIMKEAKKVYMESSKSFEQLSQRSKTSQNISDLLSTSKASTPTPKSVSSLPMDPGEVDSDYSEDFSQESRTHSHLSSPKSSHGKVSPDIENLYKDMENLENRLDSFEKSQYESQSVSKSASASKFVDATDRENKAASKENQKEIVDISSKNENINAKDDDDDERKVVKEIDKMEDNHKKTTEEIDNLFKKPLLNMQESLEIPKTPKLDPNHIEKTLRTGSKSSIFETPKASLENLVPELHEEKKIQELTQELEFRKELIKTLEEDNKILKGNIRSLRLELQGTQAYLEKLKSQTLTSPEISRELEKALEELKDASEINTSLQLQLDTVNKSHQLLKSSYDDLLTNNRNLERKVLELDQTLTKYKSELYNVQQTKEKLLENEINLNKLLDLEKLQSKSLKLQNEKDAKCILDLNRQIKEMERIIARKHPDSVSALIVAAKEDSSDTNLSARRLLEDRIKILEQEVMKRDNQQSKVFLEIQEKFNQMKGKYESHIDDLELHVNDLKDQLKKKKDSYDMYTQTILEDKMPQKESFSVSVQTEGLLVPTKTKSAPMVQKRQDREIKEDTHLLATIRGLQTDLSNKEKVILKLQKEMDETRKTNRRLQKEREGSLKNLSERKEFRSYPEKLTNQSRSNSAQDFRKEEELQRMKMEKDRLKQQLARMEEDYQCLKKKRLEDLTALQEAHEREMSNYISSLTPLKEQLELQSVTVATLQSQLTKCKEELAIVTVERDHLNRERENINDKLIGQFRYGITSVREGSDTSVEVEALLKKIDFLEKRYEEREHRLRTIIQSLAQKTVTNKSCEQCAERQRQLIAYKCELDQLLASVRALQ